MLRHESRSDGAGSDGVWTPPHAATSLRYDVREDHEQLAALERVVRALPFEIRHYVLTTSRRVEIALFIFIAEAGGLPRGKYIPIAS
jgi:hypothetical protein